MLVKSIIENCKVSLKVFFSVSSKSFGAVGCVAVAKLETWSRIEEKRW